MKLTVIQPKPVESTVILEMSESQSTALLKLIEPLSVTALCGMGMTRAQADFCHELWNAINDKK